MATAAGLATERDQRVVLHDVDWAAYEALLASREARQGRVLLSYDRGRLTIVSPSQEHEINAERLGLLIRLAAAGMGLTCLGIGRTTLKREGLLRGKEADTAFYLANEPRVRGRVVDLEVDPPPDLAVEVEATHEDPAMLALYGDCRKTAGDCPDFARSSEQNGTVPLPESPFPFFPPVSRSNRARSRQCSAHHGVATP